MQHTDTPRVARAIDRALLARVPLPLKQLCVSSWFPICESLRSWVCETKTAVSGGTRWNEGHAAGLLRKAHDCWGGEPSMSGESGTSAPELAKGDRRLAILLAMAMFVLVVDTSVMNVSIASVVHDLHTTVSGVQSAIALEALVSAAFILIGSKVGDLIGRKRAYVLGLLGYAIGALAMALAQGLTAIIVFWAIVGGIGASLLLPAMQSLIHGNFEGGAQRQAYALVGAAAAIAAAVGPLLGGFITTYLSWRIAFLLEDVIIVVVLSGIRLVHDVEYTGSRRVDVVGAILSVLGMGGIVLGILVWQEGGEAVGLLLALGAVSLGALAWWLVRRKRAGKAVLLDPDLFKAKLFRFGVSGQVLQQIGLGGTMIALPIYLQIVLEYSAMGAGLSIAPLSLSMFAVALLAGKRAGKRRPASLIRAGFALFTIGMIIVEPIVPRATSGWYLVVPLLIAGSGLGLMVSQLNNYTLAPISEERVSEAAGVNSAGGSFGLSFGLAFAGAILLAALSIGFTSMAQSSTVLSPAEQQQVAKVLEHDAQVVSNTQLQKQLASQPQETQDEIIRINTQARHLALQVALLIPILAGLAGLLISFRMMRQPDPQQSGPGEQVVLG
jgi:EmrB/QacA subfamily drug resistance transporter